MLVHDRNPESMRTVPRVCAAGRDSVPGHPRHLIFFRLFFEKSAPEGKMARNQMFWVPGDHFFGARNFSDFWGFSTSPNIASCCAPGTSGIRDFHFLLGVGIRAPHSVIRRLGAGIQSLESGIAAFGSPTRPSISTYSRSTAPAAVKLENSSRVRC